MMRVEAIIEPKKGAENVPAEVGLIWVLKSETHSNGYELRVAQQGEYP